MIPTLQDIDPLTPEEAAIVYPEAVKKMLQVKIVYGVDASGDLWALSTTHEESAYRWNEESWETYLRNETN